MSLTTFLDKAEAKTTVALHLLKMKLQTYILFWQECRSDLIPFEGKAFILKTGDGETDYVKFELIGDRLTVSNSDNTYIDHIHARDNAMLAAAINEVLASHES